VFGDLAFLTNFDEYDVDLKKYTDINNPDCNDLDVAIKMINALAIAMNHAQKRN
jgi:hypothetical protein